MKYTLQSKFLPTIAPYLINGSLPPDTYKSTIQSLHTSAVASTIASRPPNRVLQQPDPPIAEEEQTLSRPYPPVHTEGYSADKRYSMTRDTWGIFYITGNFAMKNALKQSFVSKI